MWAWKHTIGSVSYLIHRYEAQTQVQDHNKSEKYRPLIIVAPASVILQWFEQIDHFFKHKLKVIIFWGNSEHVSETSRKERTVNNWDALRTKLGRT